MAQGYVEAAFRAHAPWNSPEPWADLCRREKKKEKIECHDTPEQMERCENCPYPNSMCDDNIGSVRGCKYRLYGEMDQQKMEKPRRVKEPPGYDEERLKAAMEHNYLEKDIAAALGISKHMVRRWLAWRWR